MRDFQKFKEDYLNLKTADETIPPILDLLESSNGKGRLNIVFYDSDSFKGHTIEYRKFVSMMIMIKYISKINDQNFILIYKSEKIKDKDVLEKIRKIETTYLKSSKENEIYWYVLNGSHFLSSKDFPFVHQKMIDTPDELFSEISMSLTRDKFIKPLYWALYHEAIISIVGREKYGIEKLYGSLDDFMMQDLKM
ncbi:hypothetical protein JDFnp4_148 [Fusobacterium phage JD-Fnp4]|nr:hypothetical protein JDFnp4_148 [Fusobacterium phage JD-Fnp4]